MSDEVPYDDAPGLYDIGPDDYTDHAAAAEQEAEAAWREKRRPTLLREVQEVLRRLHHGRTSVSRAAAAASWPRPRRATCAGPWAAATGSTRTCAGPSSGSWTGVASGSCPPPGCWTSWRT